ncbi:MAG: ClpXP protease specificity-enhancing factor SspB [Hyphomicrobiaceae bacterium]
MTGELSIDYEALAQDAMRDIVRTALRQVAALGYLPGEHHFYIAFDTRASGVVVSKRLKERYPEEMTIVLQHQFRDLSVDEHRFEVTLSFDSKLERLTVPLRALRVFFDPSVPYGLQFESSDLTARAVDEADAPGAEAADSDGSRPVAVRPPPQHGMRDMSAEPGAPAKVRGRKPRAAQSEPARQKPAASAADGNVAEPTGAALSRSPAGRPMLVQPKPDEPANDSKVVQLDKFRKR